MPSVESKSGVTNDGTLDVRPYVVVGPRTQTAGYGWGTYLWGGRTVAQVTTQLMNNGGNYVSRCNSQVILTSTASYFSCVWKNKNRL